MEVPEQEEFVMKSFRTLLAICAMAIGLGASAASAADFPAIKSPVLVTSIGQSPDCNTVKVLAKKAKLKDITYNPMATADDLDGQNTLLVTVGVSHKGFGVAGVNLDTETARSNALLDAAKAKNIPVILIHIGGVEGREAMSQKMLDVVTPKGDAFLVYAEGNGDGYFDKMADGKPLIAVEKPIKLIGVFKEYAAE
ncbi:DUF6305 family protein [uncultured Cohaesibacter sp.]|uniref:DUF6305 family protein n=1 Tax=uncultured Cohaesibacter sp. TaxID=1002546 RepID=UPI00292E3489|nr:DUF6305 family protein [uncultured Cohaesibacter sp.]